MRDTTGEILVCCCDLQRIFTCFEQDLPTCLENESARIRGGVVGHCI